MGCFCSGKQVFDTSKIPDGYYHGSDKLFKSVYVKIMNDTAIADFIYFQKYPRDLITDTLIYNESNKIWVGRSSKMYQKNDKYYVSLNELFVFGKTELRIKLKEKYYKETIDEYKNIAVLHKFKEDYLNKSVNKEAAGKLFVEAGEKYGINKILKKLKHTDFLKELEKFKFELKTK